jgi:hypothetical protein
LHNKNDNEIGGKFSFTVFQKTGGIALEFYRAIAKEKVNTRFLISNSSVGGLSLCRRQHASRKLKVGRVCSKGTTENCLELGRIEHEEERERKKIKNSRRENKIMAKWGIQGALYFIRSLEAFLPSTAARSSFVRVEWKCSD